MGKLLQGLFPRSGCKQTDLSRSHSQTVPFSLPPEPENYVLGGHLGTMGSVSQEAILPSFCNCLLMDYYALGIMLGLET